MINQEHRPNSKTCLHTKGFTLIELLVVIGIFAVLSSLVIINLAKPQITVSLDTVTNTLIADIRNQQINAMVGKKISITENGSFGIYFDTNYYVLFKDDTYNPGDAQNFRVDMDFGVTLSNNFSGNTLIFDYPEGLVNSYSMLNNEITLTHSSGTSQTISVNRFGAISEN